jgi:Domain of unknown function (DUF309)
MTKPASYFGEGINLFNNGKFFECHEAWEEVWKRSAGDEKLFYQGIIQAAPYEKGRTPLWDGVAEVWFDSDDAMRSNAATPEYKGCWRTSRISSRAMRSSSSQTEHVIL